MHAEDLKKLGIKIRADKDKERVLKRIMDDSVRIMGQTFRQAKLWMESEVEIEMVRQRKVKLVCHKFVNQMSRTQTWEMLTGWKKLWANMLERKMLFGNKVEFIAKMVMDKNSRLLLQAYNGLKSTNVREMGKNDSRKTQIKKSYLEKWISVNTNMASRALNQLKSYSRSASEFEKKQNETSNKIKTRCLEKIGSTGFWGEKMAFSRLKTLNDNAICHKQGVEVIVSSIEAERVEERTSTDGVVGEMYGIIQKERENLIAEIRKTESERCAALEDAARMKDQKAEEMRS